MSAASQRYCRECGQPLAPGAAFCRGCGAAVRPAATPAPTTYPPAPAPLPSPAPQPPPAAPPPASDPSDPPEPKPKRRGRVALLAVLAVLCLAGGAAAAIVLLGGEDSNPEGTSTGEAATIPSTAPTTTRTEEASPDPTEGTAAVGAIGAGRYIQVGSYRTAAAAEAERERIEAAGIRVVLIDSSEADELYPGFQVLVAGPFTDSAAEQRVLERLHRSKVPSAFARPLTPAREIVGPEGVAGEWAGTLERTGTGSEDLDGPLEVTLSAPADGQTAELNFKKPDCRLDLALEEAGDLSLAYGQEGECVGEGSWRLRPRGDELSLVLLPPNSEVIVLGVLDRR